MNEEKNRRDAGNIMDRYMYYKYRESINPCMWKRKKNSGATDFAG